MAANIDGRLINYIRNDTSMTYSNAVSWCNSLNGSLPIPSSPAENQILTSLGNTWLGFTTSNMTGVLWFNWGHGKPSGNGQTVQLLDRAPWDNQHWYGQWNDGNDRKYPATCYLSGKIVFEKKIYYTV